MFTSETARFQHLVELYLSGQLNDTASEDCPEPVSEAAPSPASEDSDNELS